MLVRSLKETCVIQLLVRFRIIFNCIWDVNKELYGTWCSPLFQISEKMGTKQQTMKYHKAKIVYLSGLPDNMTDSELNNCIHKM